MKLVTFPGQGTPIPVAVLKALIRNKDAQFNTILNRGLHRRDLLEYIFRNPSSPGSIAVCSNFLYEMYGLISEDLRPHHRDSLILLGHSLGELTCLKVNELFTTKELFEIANYRNDLMVKYTEQYLRAYNRRGSKFEMWALSSPKATDLPYEIHKLLTESPTFPGSHTISVANANSVKQCVVTGLVEDLEALRTELHLNIPRLRISELINPHNLPFHNNTVLRPIQEPLYDFIWKIMKNNGTHTWTTLNHPIVSNLDGKETKFIHHALDKFVKCSSTTVQFTKCYDTINRIAEATKDQEDPLDTAICIGPGNVIYNLIRRNVPSLKCVEYSSMATIDSYHGTHDL